MRNDVDGSFENLFDQGPAANCLQFWGTRGALDWGPVYQEQWKVSRGVPEALAFPPHDVALARGLGLGLGPKPYALFPPAIVGNVPDLA